MSESIFAGLESLSLSPCCLNVESQKGKGSQKRTADGAHHGSKKRRLARQDATPVVCIIFHNFQF